MGARKFCDKYKKNFHIKIPGEIETNAPTLNPAKGNLAIKFLLNDDFGGSGLTPQWQFFGGYDTTRFRLSGQGLKIKAKGNSVANCSPLLCIPSDHFYTAQVELLIEGNATGGLVFFTTTNIIRGFWRIKKIFLPTSVAGSSRQKKT